MYCFISSLLFKFVISVFRLNKQKTLVYNRDPSLRVGLSLLKRKIKKSFYLVDVPNVWILDPDLSERTADVWFKQSLVAVTCRIFCYFDLLVVLPI